MRPVSVKVQMDGVCCTQCGEEFEVDASVYWRHGEGLFHPQCPSPVMMEREACLQALEHRIKLFQRKLEARFPGDDGTEIEHASSPLFRSIIENLKIVHNEIAGGAHLGNVVWPPPERDDEPEPETWRLLADTACEILGRWDVHSRLLPEDKAHADTAFELLGRLVDKTQKVEKS